jgi:CheY-like chemotaxis protein
MAENCGIDKAPTAEKPLSGRKILIVDDDPFVPTLLSRILGKNGGADVSVAANGSEGLALLRKSPFSLVFTDTNMPIMDGPTLIGQIRQDVQLRFLPVVLMSAGEIFANKTSEEIRQIASAHHANAGMQKPLTSPFAPIDIARQLLEDRTT